MWSAVSRAILKPVYGFGIPKSNPQTLKSVKINSSKNRQLTFQTLVPQCVEPQEGCFELLRIQNRQKFFWGFAPGPHWGGLQHPLQTPQLYNGFSHYARRKTSTSKNCWIRHWWLTARNKLTYIHADYEFHLWLTDIAATYFVLFLQGNYNIVCPKCSSIVWRK